MVVGEIEFFHSLLVGALKTSSKTFENNETQIQNRAATRIQNRAATRAAPTIGDIVGGFKSLTTNEYIYGVKHLGWAPFNSKIWQRNYYEHIIRDERAYQNISNYIINNPAKWKGDKFYER